jgi:hypothetical protein
MVFNFIQGHSRLELTGLVMVSLACAAMVGVTLRQNTLVETVRSQDIRTQAERDKLAKQLFDDRFPGAHAEIGRELIYEKNEGREIHSIDDVVLPTLEEIREEAAKRKQE